ncbi:DUF835 domain-containing protein [Thermococcus sp.]|uniref:DUF835 domain-containing protein n=1 Tax=Thermococcus sp. TaxID=35749 RepID=UPI0025DCF055|nr:DUF835 domain-containing protein [Thermococcus sp.]
MLFIAAIIVEVMLIAILAVSIKRRASFTSHYPELKKFYDYSLAALAGFTVSKLVFFPLDLRDSGFLDILPGQIALLNLTGNTLLMLSAIAFILGWVRLIGTLVARYELVPVIEFTGEGKRLSLKPGVYLCTLANCYSTVLRLLAGRAGLIISRQPPQVIRSRLKVEKTPVIWLTTAPGERTVRPTRLEYLLHIIVEFIKKTEAPKLVFLEGVEYLILENGFTPVFKFLTTLKDYAIIHNTIVVVPVDVESLEEKQANLLKREFETIDPKVLPQLGE